MENVRAGALLHHKRLEMITKFIQYFFTLCRVASVSHDGKYLIVYVDEKGDETLVYYADLEKNGEITKKLSLNPIITEFNNTYAVRFLEFFQLKIVHIFWSINLMTFFAVCDEYWFENGLPYESKCTKLSTCCHRFGGSS